MSTERVEPTATDLGKCDGCGFGVELEQAFVYKDRGGALKQVVCTDCWNDREELE